MPDSLKPYLQQVEQALKAGNATEHTHRPALKALLESLDLSVTATNEPKRIACGAPDYVVTRAELIVGYIEAKDMGQPLAEGRVYLNQRQYFEGVPPQVWAFQVGGYQVCDKWLKDRRERQLSYDDLTHYQRVIVALRETIRLMVEIDAAIPGWPLDS